MISGEIMMILSVINAILKTLLGIDVRIDETIVFPLTSKDNSKNIIAGINRFVRLKTSALDVDTRKSNNISSN